MKLKIFSYGWHVSHQYELCKFPNTQFFYIKNRIRKEWNYANRPFPKNLNLVNHYEEGKYDLAILHIDQQCLFGHPKGIPYQELNKQIQDIPKIVINHGTPYYQKYPKEMIVRKMKEAIGGNTMIVNSHKAQKEWEFGEVIIHGLDPSEWYNLEKKNRIITTVSPGMQDGDHTKDGWAKYYNRFLFDDVRKKVPIVWIGHDKTFDSWESYRQFIGQSLIYFNPTRHSPMPRSRTEAMLSGCCVVTTPWHGADKFIEDGVNGYLVKTEAEMVKKLRYLKRHPATAKKVGERGRITALRLFHKDRYQKEWDVLIDRVMSDYVPMSIRPLRNKLLTLFDLAIVKPKKFTEHFEVLLDTILSDHFKQLTNPNNYNLIIKKNGTKRKHR